MLRVTIVVFLAAGKDFGEIRNRAGQSQRQVALALGFRQPSLSKMEKQSDMQISTLRPIVNALGGELGVWARFPDGNVKVEPSNSTKLAGAKRSRRRFWEGWEAIRWARVGMSDARLLRRVEHSSYAC